MPSPNVPAVNNYLNGVAAAAPDDAWAVGDQNGQSLIEHWDGRQWSIGGAQGGGILLDVSIVSATDVWAVGLYVENEKPFSMHWDGTKWNSVSTPPLPMGGRLEGVVALATDNVWAVGWSYVPGIYSYTLIEHWDGNQWSVVPSPNVGPNNNYLMDVAAIAGNDVWAVGFCNVCNGVGYGSLALHWDGQSWTVVDSPNVGMDTRITAVAAVTSDDVWAVGGDQIFHWEGSVWTLVTHPSLPGGDVLDSIAARAADDIWAVGYNGADIYTVALHWDGSTWSIVPSPNPGSSDNSFYGVFALAAADVWAVGRQWNGGRYTTLIEHYSDPCVTPSPSPTPSASPTAPAPPPTTPTATVPVPATGTPVPSATAAPATGTLSPPPSVTRTPLPPSSTSLPPTNTPAVPPTPTLAASATPCPISFSDVYPTDYFYQPVLYLACHGVISGYADGTFRPFADTTRGQMVKIVVLGFGLPSSTPAGGAHTFADVPPTFPFFSVIETAAAHQVVSGYACGGPGEPCDSQQRPYFRPYANVTRGQLSKIDVVAAGWELLNPAGPTFTDVAPGSAFYRFVETAFCHQVISGYADRTFRPGANATRGQISKIVYLSVA